MHPPVTVIDAPGSQPPGSNSVLDGQDGSPLTFEPPSPENTESPPSARPQDIQTQDVFYYDEDMTIDDLLRSAQADVDDANPTDEFDWSIFDAEIGIEVPSTEGPHDGARLPNLNLSDNSQAGTGSAFPCPEISVSLSAPFPPPSPPLNGSVARESPAADRVDAGLLFSEPLRFDPSRCTGTSNKGHFHIVGEPEDLFSNTEIGEGGSTVTSATGDAGPPTELTGGRSASTRRWGAAADTQKSTSSLSPPMSPVGGYKRSGYYATDLLDLPSSESKRCRLIGLHEPPTPPEQPLIGTQHDLNSMPPGNNGPTITSRCSVSQSAGSKRTINLVSKEDPHLQLNKRQKTSKEALTALFDKDYEYMQH